MGKVFVEVGYYEIMVRPFRAGDVAQCYSGVGGLFERHTNVFRSFDSCMNFLGRKRFDDNILVHVSFENEVSERFPMSIDDDFERTDCGEFIKVVF